MRLQLRRERNGAESIYAPFFSLEDSFQLAEIYD
jgi:hypothetical protein